MQATIARLRYLPKIEDKKIKEEKNPRIPRSLMEMMELVLHRFYVEAIREQLNREMWAMICRPMTLEERIDASLEKLNEAFGGLREC